MTLDEYLKNQNGGSKSATPSQSYDYLAEAQKIRDIKIIFRRKTYEPIGK